MQEKFSESYHAFLKDTKGIRYKRLWEVKAELFILSCWVTNSGLCIYQIFKDDPIKKYRIWKPIE